VKKTHAGKEAKLEILEFLENFEAFSSTFLKKLHSRTPQKSPNQVVKRRVKKNENQKITFRSSQRISAEIRRQFQRRLRFIDGTSWC
jgi:hypothetical protein